VGGHLHGVGRPDDTMTAQKIPTDLICRSMKLLRAAIT